MRHGVVAFIAGLLFLLISGFTLNWQLFHSARNVAIEEARLAISMLDGMVDEARDATTTAKSLTAETCSEDAQRVLNKEAAMHPHLRYVVLIKHNQIWCSSLLGTKSLSFQESKTTLLKLYPSDEVTGGTPVLLYVVPGLTGHVAASIGFVHLNTALRTATGKPNLTLVVGDQSLAYPGQVKAGEIAGQQLQSARYPFSVAYTPPPFFSLGRLTYQGNLLLFILGLTSFIFAWLVWRHLNKYTTPEQNLKRAIQRGEIIPFYQPVVDGVTGKIAGFEILARWKHPVAGYISPDVFIPIAEKTDLIIDLTHALMMQVLVDLKPLAHSLPDELHIGFNISASHESSYVLEHDCLTLLREFENKKFHLVLEITEREPLMLTPKAKAMFARLRSHGVLLALDDFGTGYSGLSYLTEIKVDYIKIDRSFVRRISNESDSTLLIDCVIEMAKKLSLNIIAEGVETQHQVNYLNSKEIKLLQGYYFCRPMPFSRLAPALMFGFHRIKF